MALSGAVRSDEAEAARPTRLELNLVDGSRILGKPGIKTVPVQTSYAKLELSLEHIRVITMGDDRETATVELRKGDKTRPGTGPGARPCRCPKPAVSVCWFTMA